MHRLVQLLTVMKVKRKRILNSVIMIMFSERDSSEIPSISSFIQ